MKKSVLVKSLVLVFAGILFSQSSFAMSDKKRLEKITERGVEAGQIVDEIMAKEDSIPVDLLNAATCVAVYPNVLKVGFIGAIERGKGIVTCKVEEQDGAQSWSEGVYTSITGGSVGWQIGVRSTDLILVFVDKNAHEKFAVKNVTLGVDLSVAAGPVGRNLKAGVDYKLDSGVYTYSKSKGFFAGVALEGSAILPAEKDNLLVYGTNESADLEVHLATQAAQNQLAIPYLQSLYNALAID